MKLVATELSGLWLVELEPIVDGRGFFARSFCGQAFAAHGLDPLVAQTSISYNAAVATLRGLHGARPGLAEAKLVRCTAGAIWDVVVDARRQSPTFGRWVAVELSAANRRATYISPGLLHGFVTLSEDAEVFYQMSQPHDPSAQWGAHWNSPELAIAWPVGPKVMSAADTALPPFHTALAGIDA